MKRLMTLVFAAFVLNSALALAQFSGTVDEALQRQLVTNGASDPANATSAELAAAVEGLMVNNPDLTTEQISNLVSAAVAQNPEAYQAIAVAAAEQAAAGGRE